jgi:hypothetical protein
VLAVSRARCSEGDEDQQGGRGRTAAGYARHNLDRRIIDGPHRDPGGQPRSTDRAPDQAGKIELVLIVAAHQEFLECDVDGCWLVDRQHDLGVVGDGLEAQRDSTITNGS